jgi:hypothetical protein
MNQAVRVIARVASALAATGGLVIAAALPAAAASPNEAFAAQATGLISVSPIGEATFPGTSPVTVANASIAGLLTTGTATANAGPTSASETVNTVSGILGLLTTLGADSVTSSCSFDTNTGAVTGTAGITNGSVTTPLTTIPLASNPAPNTVIGVPGIANITLNEQTTAGDGTLTVTAISIQLLGSTQTIDLATSVCNAADLAPVPILPGKALQVLAAGLGLLVLAGFAYQLSRRRRAVVAG